MKCGYCSNDVTKEEAVKDGRYYHKDCYRIKQGKKKIEEYWLNNINSGTVIQLLRKTIKDIVELYDVEYILWVLKRCKGKNIKLQYPQGIKGCCDIKEFKDEWNKSKIILEYSKIKNEIMDFDNNDVVFNYVSNNRKVSDII